jgi:hypothetical protein
MMAKVKTGKVPAISRFSWMESRGRMDDGWVDKNPSKIQNLIPKLLNVLLLFQ